ncbi:DUF4158 domain-containing protein [Streptomyces sp. NPDC101194]|uniref:DUF4158 domain-containing protein n=1 Tax=Streptomyces sp. NPDC101194 TaxID=3366127 RepID=UPI0037F28612
MGCRQVGKVPGWASGRPNPFFSPTRDELEWVAGATDGDEHLPALLLMLKSYQRVGCFPAWENVPEQVVEFVRRQVELPEGTLPLYRTAKQTSDPRGPWPGSVSPAQWAPRRCPPVGR